MSFLPNVTKADLINLAKITEQQKVKGTKKIENRILKQSPDEEIVKTFSPLTKTLAKVKASTEKSKEVFEKHLS